MAGPSWGVMDGVPVHVGGRGIAAAAAIRALAARGIAVTADAPDPMHHPRAPLVLLGEPAQALLGDVFAGHAPLDDLMAGAHRIERRIVRWGDRETNTFAHSGTVLAGDRLGVALWPDVAVVPVRQPQRFELTAHGGDGFARRQFGERQAASAPVVLRPDADDRAAYVEALDSGWIFLVPTGNGQGWLLTVGADPADAVAVSSLAATVVAEIGPVAARFETAPRLADPPLGRHGLALGSAALAFDPICGDGTATAVRGALLAAAVAAAMAGADLPDLDPAVDRADLTGHYRLMLIAAMRRHLAGAYPFYAAGGDGPWWRQQSDAMAAGHAWCTAQLAEAGEARFVLAGDRLVRRDVLA